MLDRLKNTTTENDAETHTLARRTILKTGAAVGLAGLGVSGVTAQTTDLPISISINAEDETITIQNTGDSSVDLTGYQINFEAGPSSENDQIRTLAGTITVDAGSSLTVAAGGGASGDATLEQPYEGNVLNNQNPDTVALLAPDGTTIATTGEQTPQQGQDQDPQQDQEQQDQPQEQAPTDVSPTFADQTSDGTMVTIESATLPDGGFVAIHDSSLQDGQVLDSVIGVSDALNAGTHQNIEIQLFEGVPTQMFSQDALNEDQTLIAMPHFDTDSDGRYDFVCAGGEKDGPYTADGEAVVDEALVTIEDS